MRLQAGAIADREAHPLRQRQAEKNWHVLTQANSAKRQDERMYMQCRQCAIEVGGTIPRRSESETKGASPDEVPNRCGCRSGAACVCNNFPCADD